MGHCTENCRTLNVKMQELINTMLLSFQQNTPDAEGSGINVKEGNMEHDH